MEPQPAGTTRPYTPTDCRKEALYQCFMFAICLNMVFSPPHWTLLLRWAVILMFLVLGCIYTQSTLYWLLLSRYMGQTVTWRIGPRGRAWWQRTVTYSIPRVPTKPKDPTPASVIITLGWTLATGIMLLLTANAFIDLPKANIWTGLLYIVIDIPLIVYTAYNWKRVRQDRQRRVPARTRNIAP